MKEHKTSRGFTKIEFTDRNGVKASLQESSLAMEPAVWLGAEEIGLKVLYPDEGWKDVTEEKLQSMFFVDAVLANTRLHLSQEQVKELLPVLQRFVETGRL